MELPTIFFPYDIESKNAIYVKFCYKNFYMCLAYVQNINMNINQTKLNWDILIYHYIITKILRSRISRSAKETSPV